MFAFGWRWRLELTESQHRREKPCGEAGLVWWRNVAGTVPAGTAPPSRHSSSEPRFRNRPGAHDAAAAVGA